MSDALYLPIKNESIPVLRKRYPDALRETFTNAFLDKFSDERPGLRREHVFDLKDEYGVGWRFIVSYDQFDADGLPKDRPVLHVSFSGDFKGGLEDFVRAGVTRLLAFAEPPPVGLPSLCFFTGNRICHCVYADPHNAPLPRK